MTDWLQKLSQTSITTSSKSLLEKSKIKNIIDYYYFFIIIPNSIVPTGVLFSVIIERIIVTIIIAVKCQVYSTFLCHFQRKYTNVPKLVLTSVGSQSSGNFWKVQKYQRSETKFHVMIRGGSSGRLARTITRRLVAIMAISCAMRFRIRGFVSVPSTQIMTPRVDCAARRCSTLLSNSNIWGENRLVPTVVNPVSKRRIHLGGTISKANTTDKKEKDTMLLFRKFMYPIVF